MRHAVGLLAWTLMAVVIPIGSAAAEPPAGGGLKDADSQPGALRTGTVMMALGLAATTYATWSWATNDSRVALLENLEPGPHMDWTALDAPAASVLLMSLGGVEVIRGTRGRGAELPSGYWLGLVPAAVALSVEAVAMEANAEPTRAQELTVAIGTAASAAWFGASALWEVFHAPPGSLEDLAGARPARALAVVPVIGWGAGGGHVGFAMAGTL